MSFCGSDYGVFLWQDPMIRPTGQTSCSAHAVDTDTAREKVVNSDDVTEFHLRGRVPTYVGLQASNDTKRHNY